MKNLLLIVLLSFSAMFVWAQEADSISLINEVQIESEELEVEKEARKKSLTREEQMMQHSVDRMNGSHTYVGLIPELSGNNGVKILKIVPESPADIAGLLEGDLIRELDGKIIRSINIIVSTMNKSEAGETLEWTIRRDDAESIVPIKLIANDNYIEAKKIKRVETHPDAKKVVEPIHLILSAGFSVQVVDGYFKVVGMNAKGKAYASGLRVGDVITELNGEKADTKEKLVDVLVDADKGSKYKLSVIRDDDNKKIKLEY